MKRTLLTQTAVISVLSLHAEISLTELAVSDDPAAAIEAQHQLREMGQPGLDALMLRYNTKPVNIWTNVSKTQTDVKLSDALNFVSAQYDSHASGLYWFTDLEKAKEAAAATGRPILSLRLLGKLDTDLSCANSRLFRTTLYPDPTVNELLRNRFVLHWESVRPVPVMTIDFGDENSAASSLPLR